MTKEKGIYLLKRVIQFSLIFLILVYLFKRVDPHKFYVSFTQYSPWALIATILSILLSYAILSLRWNYLAGNIGIIPSFETVIVADFLNLVLPARIGDLSKVAYLKKYYNKDTHTTFSALFIERFLDINVLFLFTILVFFFYVRDDRVKLILIILFVIIVGFLVLLKTKIIKRVVYFLPYRRIRDYIIKIVDGIDQGLTFRVLSISIMYTVLLWFSYFLKNIVFFRYGAHFPLNIYQIFLLFAVSTVSFTIPITPGGMGTYQASIVFITTLYGIGKEEALAAGILLQLIQILVTSSFFVIIFFRKGLSLLDFKNVKREDLQ